MITFIPRYAKLFDSHERLGLPDVNYSYNPPLKVPLSLLSRADRRRCARERLQKSYFVAFVGSIVKSIKVWILSLPFVKDKQSD